MGMVVAPTYPMLRDTTLRTFLELAKQADVVLEHHRSEHRVDLINGSRILFRTAEHPDRLRGANLGWFWLDEAALMPTETWDIMLGRLREQPGSGWVTSTPRGFNWLFDVFVEADDPDCELIRCSTGENPYLPDGYIDSLERRYSGPWADQELRGEFVDLEGAGLFLVDHLPIVDAIPAALSHVRRWDMAATAGGGDWTVGVLMAGPDSDGRFYVVDVVRGQWEPSERDRIIRQTSELDGKSVKVVGPQDPGAAGVQAAQAFVRLLSGFSVTTERETGDKVTRADPFAAQVNAGNVSLVRGDWVREFIEELRRFPHGSHDDQVDAAAGAFSRLAERRAKRLVYALG
jgi:predicted phage terminase large subunit-like protein